MRIYGLPVSLDVLLISNIEAHIKTVMEKRVDSPTCFLTFPLMDNSNHSPTELFIK